jgi:hypothetical protein
MIFLSLNIRGVGGILKSCLPSKTSSEDFTGHYFLQETMVEDKKARAFMNYFRPSWLSCVVSSVGTSGGLLVTWDPKMFDISPFLCCGGILLTGTCLELNLSITLLNVYGPCLDRKSFWEKVAARGLLARRNLILAGDLNLTCDVGELWGDATHLDPLSTFFKEFFNGSGLVDIAPGCFGADLEKWQKGHCGVYQKDWIASLWLKISLRELVDINRGWIFHTFQTMHLSF